MKFIALVIRSKICFQFYEKKALKRVLTCLITAKIIRHIERLPFADNEPTAKRKIYIRKNVTTQTNPKSPPMLVMWDFLFDLTFNFWAPSAWCRILSCENFALVHILEVIRIIS